MEAKNLVISPVKTEERKKLDIRSGDVVKVWQKIKEKDKFRSQVFEGLVLAVKHGKEAGGTFTIRKVASGVGVERIFPLYSPMIEKIEIVKRSKVRRAKLYHIRDKAAKEIKRQMRNIKKLPDMISADESRSEEDLKAKNSDSDSEEIKEESKPSNQESAAEGAEDNDKKEEAGDVVAK